MTLDIAEGLKTQDGTSEGQTSNDIEIVDANASEKGDEQTEGNSDIIELDGADKIKFRGQEYTPEELDQAMLRQSDYTRKSQDVANDRKEIESHQNYIDNVAVDLERIRANPALADQFKQVYPEQYHRYLKFVGTPGQVKGKQGDAENNLTNLPPEVTEKLRKLDTLEAKMDKLDRFEQTFRVREVEAADKVLDVVFDKFGKEYPYAVEDSILNTAQSMLEANKDNPKFEITNAAWGRMFKQSNEFYQKRWDKTHGGQVDAQLEASKKASDSGPGGAAPGRQPAKAQTFDEASESMIRDLRAQGLR